MNELLTLAEAAQFLRVHENTLLRLVAAKKVPGKKVGRQWRFHKSVLDRYLGVPARGEKAVA